MPGLVGESTRLRQREHLDAILATPGVDLCPAPDGCVVSISWPVDRGGSRVPDGAFMVS
ncbi:hypothetical protein [Streptomyces sp. NPDC002851]